jgi:uncharacterized protein with beta-barrel porin domain
MSTSSPYQRRLIGVLLAFLAALALVPACGGVEDPIAEDGVATSEETALGDEGKADTDNTCRLNARVSAYVLCRSRYSDSARRGACRAGVVFGYSDGAAKCDAKCDAKYDQQTVKVRACRQGARIFLNLASAC